MNPRERLLASVLAALLGVGGAGFLFYTLFLGPYRQRQAELTRLSSDADSKEQRQREIQHEKPRLERWKQLSLPPDIDLARLEYERYLNGLLRASGVPSRSYTITARRLEESKSALGQTAKPPVYTKLTYAVTAHGDLASLVKVLEGFYKTGLLHQIRSVTIQKPNETTAAGRARELEATFTVEALVVKGAEKRAAVLPNIRPSVVPEEVMIALLGLPQGLPLALQWSAGPSGPLGPGLLQPKRDYSRLASHDPFHGTSPSTDPRGTPQFIAPRFARLTDFTQSGLRSEASLFDVYNKRPFRLRVTPGFNSFPFVRDGQGKAVVQGVVLKIDPDERGIILSVGLQTGDPPSPGDERDGFFRLTDKEKDKLVADQVARTDEIDRVVKVERAYWQFLIESRLVEEFPRGHFQIDMAGDQGGLVNDESPRLHLTSGKVLAGEGADVFLIPEDRFFALRVGQTLQEALAHPLPEDRVRDLKSAKASP
jgi:hypothetical protein